MAHSGSKLTSRFNLKGLALGLVGLCAAFTAIAAPIGSAHAGAPDRFNVGQCGAAETVMKAIGQDGHGFVANMNADKVDTAQKKFIKIEHIITATPNGSHWYMLRGDGAKGQSSKLCIAMKGINLEINDNFDNTNTPTVTPITYKQDDARAKCIDIKKQHGINVVCNGRDSMLSGFHKSDGQILMMQGTSILSNGDMSTIFSLIADPANQNDYRTLSTNKSSGATVIAQRGTDAQFSQRVYAEIQARN